MKNLQHWQWNVFVMDAHTLVARNNPFAKDMTTP